jgi:hypothetical protein
MVSYLTLFAAQDDNLLAGFTADREFTCAAP